MRERGKPSPDELLRQVESQAESERSHAQRGRLKVFLGYASGVGKSHRMFDEGRRRKMRGEDVVVAATQLADAEMEPLLAQFEVIPPLASRNGAPLDGAAIDVAAVKRRRPSVCLIDGLAYHNPPSCPNQERWQDVEELRASGISVITTINLQYIREKQTQVEAIRHRRAKDSVPEEFLRTADEIEIVDAPPEYCVQRAQEINRDRERPGTDPAELERQLSALREMALLLTAEVVDAQLDRYLHRHGIDQTYGAQEKVQVCITPRSNAELMIRRGRRQADRFHGELFVTYVEQPNLAPADQATLNRNLEAARKAGAQVAELHGEDIVKTILDFANTHGVTQIFVGHSQRYGLLQQFRPNPVERLILESSGIDVRIFPNQDRPPVA